MLEPVWSVTFSFLVQMIRIALRVMSEFFKKTRTEGQPVVRVGCLVFLIVLFVFEARWHSSASDDASAIPA